MDRTTLTRNLAVLEKKGVLKTGKSLNDPRVTNVTITSKGLAQIEDAMPGWQEFQKDAIQRIGKEKWLQLISILKDVAVLEPRGNTPLDLWRVPPLKNQLIIPQIHGQGLYLQSILGFVIGTLGKCALTSFLNVGQIFISP